MNRVARKPQNNYNFTFAKGVTTATACTGTGAFISSSKCGGSQDAGRLPAGQAGGDI